MTITRAREILGENYDQYSDDQIEQGVEFLSILSQMAYDLWMEKGRYEGEPKDFVEEDKLQKQETAIEKSSS